MIQVSKYLDNVYVLQDRAMSNAILVIGKKRALLFDTGCGMDNIKETVESITDLPLLVILSHGHFDHIGAVDDLRAYFKGVQCYAGEKEEEVLENGSYNLSASWAAALSIRADRLLRDKETLTLAGFKIKVIETPGHTKGGVCYYLSEEGVLFSGDTLFRTSVGRTDFPTGSMSQIVRSVQYLTEKLPGDTVVYPGHQEITTIAYEQRFNPYLS